MAGLGLVSTINFSSIDTEAAICIAVARGGSSSLGLLRGHDLPAWFSVGDSELQLISSSSRPETQAKSPELKPTKTGSVIPQAAAANFAMMAAAPKVRR